MYRLRLYFCLALFFLPYLLISWGFESHRLINQKAVFTLPTPLLKFYKLNINYIEAHAVDADKRRYAVAGEAEKHYIDIEHYVSSSDSLTTIPKYWTTAVEQYSEDSLKKYGWAPWNVYRVYRLLEDAFLEKNENAILKLSADLGHYVGDIYVPLHTTENYNGQLSGQKGIHAFWETRLPALFKNDYDFFTGKAVFIEHPIDNIWEAIYSSHLAVDSVLSFERELNATFPEDQKYGFEQKGKSRKKVYSEAYSTAYHQRLNGMVERRLRSSIRLLGCLWYSAWVNAGQPVLKAKNISSGHIDKGDFEEHEER